MFGRLDFFATFFRKVRSTCTEVFNRCRNASKWKRGVAIVLLPIILGTYLVFFMSPTNFPVNSYVIIKKGETTRQVATTLEKRHIIFSANIFTALVSVFAHDSGVRAGTYRFNKSSGLLFVTHRLIKGDFGISPIRITLFEGMTAREMGKSLSAKFPNITVEDFRKASYGEEGYLFPDTYSFLPDVSAKKVVSTMRHNFDIRIASITPEIQSSGHTLKDIVIMASLIEREGRTLKEKRMISGILWHRINIGMPLQVDSVFGYIFGRKTYSPSHTDLKVDSPYNTYTHKGLPPGPISNPGIESILASATPTKTHYLYYITGKNGKMYYAKTLTVHNRNVALYLKR